jgi:hypothetical protein
VELVPADPWSQDRPRADVTDDGRFEIVRVSPGTYVLLVEDWASPARWVDVEQRITRHQTDPVGEIREADNGKQCRQNDLDCLSASALHDFGGYSCFSHDGERPPDDERRNVD